ncbi:MAG TPA: methyltransferase domain-containing protein, partial [Gemmatimonadaceae bacterium]|nr:methyltransferase domain-containing protein [Gemmatimonadaceae bacterium]
MTVLTPSRRRGIEILDDPAVDPELMRRSMRDVERANALFGGRRAALAELSNAFRGIAGTATMLDVGTGRGDIPASAVALAGKMGITLHTIGMDMSLPLMEGVRNGNEHVLRGDALALPFRDKSVDIVLASQILHHFTEDAATALIVELNRVARSSVVISDLKRSLIAAAGLWLGSFPLRFHPVSRHDGVVSVMRGFLPAEVADLVQRATGLRPRVERRLGFRVTTSWTPR